LGGAGGIAPRAGGLFGDGRRLSRLRWLGRLTRLGGGVKSQERCDKKRAVYVFHFNSRLIVAATGLCPVRNPFLLNGRIRLSYWDGGVHTLFSLLPGRFPSPIHNLNPNLILYQNE
jgi:hypothetical protein